MTGIVLVGEGIGTVIMPLLASQLIYSYGWRMSYIIVGTFALVLIILAAQFLRRDPARMGQLPYGADEAKAAGLVSEDKGVSLREAIHTGQFWQLCAVLACLCFGGATDFLFSFLCWH